MLIKCPKCNHYVSDIASVCPSCGMILKGEDTLPEKENATETSSNECEEETKAPTVSLDSAPIAPPPPPINYQEARNNKNILYAIIVILFIILCGAVVFLFTNKKPTPVPTSVQVETDSITEKNTIDEHFSVSYISERTETIFKRGPHIPNINNAIDLYFSSGFKELFRKVLLKEREITSNGNIGFWDFDMWTDAQDGEINQVTINKVYYNQGEMTAIADVVLGYGDYKKRSTINLVFEMDDWFIDDMYNLKRRMQQFIEQDFYETPYEDKNEYNEEDRYIDNMESEKSVSDVVEEMPQFPGGSSALFEFLARNVKYPVDAEENGIQGRVIVTFIVECDGSITDVKVAKGVDPSLDREAIRVIRMMPNWKPGTQNNKPVRVKYTVPVTFRLS